MRFGENLLSAQYSGGDSTDLFFGQMERCPLVCSPAAPLLCAQGISSQTVPQVPPVEQGTAQKAGRCPDPSSLHMAKCPGPNCGRSAGESRPATTPGQVAGAASPTMIPHHLPAWLICCPNHSPKNLLCTRQNPATHSQGRSG